MSDPLSSDLASLRIDRSAPPAAAKRRVPVGPIASLVAVAGVGVAGYFAWPHLEARIYETEVTLTSVARISPTQSSTTLTATGYVTPRVVSYVGATMVGRILRVATSEGAVVRAGDVLFELDPLDAERAVAAAQSQLLAANARIATARANLAEIELQADRQRRLVERGVAAQAGAEDLDARATSLRAAVDAATAEARAARSAVEVARAASQQTRIIAPIDGTVISDPPDVGAIVNPEQHLVEVADMTTLVVEVDVPEARLASVRLGGPAEIVLDAFPGRRFRGETTEIGRRIDRARATATVKVKFVDPATDVLADMAARVSFLTEQLTDDQLQAAARIVVPSNAVARRSGGTYVFVAEDGVVHARAVRLGPEGPEGYELVEGPSPGTQLVANPPSTMADGQRIEERTP